jgi:hypothetical protein
MAWFWNPTAHRYQWLNGSARFLARATVLEWVETLLSGSASASDTLADLVAGSLLAPSDWFAAMRQEIKDVYIQEYLLGIGGRGRMTQADWGSVGGMIAEQYRWLNGFYDEILAGNLTEAQIAARARMYINSANEAYERAFGRLAVKAGMDEESWNLGPVKTEHCDDCLGYENEGWQEIGYFPTPGDGSTICLTNCQCHKEYRNSATGEEFWID